MGIFTATNGTLPPTTPNKSAEPLSFWIFLFFVGMSFSIRVNSISPGYMDTILNEGMVWKNTDVIGQAEFHLAV
jgi:hypothetical protein